MNLVILKPITHLKYSLNDLLEVGRGHIFVCGHEYLIKYLLASIKIHCTRGEKSHSLEVVTHFRNLY